MSKYIVVYAYKGRYNRPIDIDQPLLYDTFQEAQKVMRSYMSHRLKSDDIIISDTCISWTECEQYECETVQIYEVIN